MPHTNPLDLRELPYGDDRLERAVLIQTDPVTLVAIDWLATQSDTEHLSVGLFGASTGARARANEARVFLTQVD